MKTFSKASIAALIATVADFGTLTFTVELLHIFYPYGVAMGAFMGAITNFFVNRHWSFEAAHHPLPKQLLKYAIVSGGSLCLNTYGVYLVTENFGIHYLISKIIVALCVGFFFNYPLHRYFVYPVDRRLKPRLRKNLT